MFRTVFLTVVVLVIAIGGGAASVWRAIEADWSFGAVTIGPWTAEPSQGTPAADPYSKARFARRADLSLGYAEGLEFSAERDSDGRLLIGSCSYAVEGQVPPARFWTLHARTQEGALQRPFPQRSPSLHSLALLREPDGTVAVTVSARAAPGNWLAVEGSGPFRLVLTLYDTSVASSARIAEVDLPGIRRTACDE